MLQFLEWYKDNIKPLTRALKQMNLAIAFLPFQLRVPAAIFSTDNSVDIKVEVSQEIQAEGMMAVQFSSSCSICISPVSCTLSTSFVTQVIIK